MCKSKEISSLELSRRGELLVRLGYAIAAGIFSALLGSIGYEAFVSGHLNGYYLTFLFVCALITYYTISTGIKYQEQAAQK